MAACSLAVVGIGNWPGGRGLKKGARKFHRNVWSVLGLLLPLIVAGALLIKQSPPDQPAVLLEAPNEN